MRWEYLAAMQNKIGDHLNPNVHQPTVLLLLGTIHFIGRRPGLPARLSLTTYG